MSSRSTTAAHHLANSAGDFERLRSSEELYRTLVESAGDGIVVLEGDVFVDCNSKALEVFGRSRDQLIGKTPFQTAPEVPVDETQTVELGREHLGRAYAGEPVRFEWEHVTADGSQRYLYVTLTRFDLPDGPRLLAIVRDVTEKTVADRELKRRTRFQRLLAEISNDFVVAAFDEVENAIDAALPKIAEIYRIDRMSLWWFDREAQVARGSLLYGFGAQQSEKSLAPFARLPWIVEYLYSGNRKPLLYPDDIPADAVEDHAYYATRNVKTCLIVPLTIGDEIAGVAGMAATTEYRVWSEDEKSELQLLCELLGNTWTRYRNERTIRARERDLARSQRVGKLGSYVVTADDESRLSWNTAIVSQSPQANEIFGIGDGCETRELILSRYHPDDRARVVDIFSNIALDVDDVTLDYRVRRPDGSIVYIEERAEFDRNELGEIFRVFGTVKDVTDRVTAAKELEVALKEIEALKDRLQAENIQLKEEVRAAKGFDTIVGDSDKLKSALVAAEKVAPTDVTVLILGETGTGKELVARSIHGLSERSAAPLICVNCAALSSDLIESELFGHEKGAFTGAQRQRKGRFELADRGTLFLDEIGDLTLEVQAKILRVLQSGEFERLGGTQSMCVDVRVIAATNRDLRAMVERGEFRADLYYRISSFPILLPPLRERREDIPMLANHFVNKYAGELGKDIHSISADMISHMIEMPWPGNVRELEGFIQRALIATTGAILDYHIPENGPCIIPTVTRDEGPDITEGGHQDLDSMQRRHIRDALDRCNWVIGGDKGAAAALGVPPSSLRSRMKRLGISRPL